jgi:shikimate dehydrogenase
MHAAAYKELGLDYEYVKEHVRGAELGDKVRNLLRHPNCAGANITIPHKEAVIPFLDELDPLAEDIGAVNTVVNNNGKLKGYNTDATGYLTSLTEQFDPKDKKVAIFGAGGAAKAIALILHRQGNVSEIAIGEVVRAKAELLAKQVPSTQAYDVTAPEFLVKVAQADLVVNTSPLGMHPHEDKTPLTDLSVIHSGQLYSDVVYVPRDTLFLRNASARGAQIHYGIGMLLFQGVIAFSHFTGIPLERVPIDTMRKALLAQ